MSTKPSNVVLNFKMSGQVEYAKTVREINAIMNTAAKEYKNHVSAMGADASATEKLRAEKKKLEVQMDAARKRTEMLRAQYDQMSNSTKTTTGQLAQMYGKLLDAENAENSLQKSLERVNGGLTDQAQEARDAKENIEKLNAESKLLEAEQKSLTSAFKLQNAELEENASDAEKSILASKQLKDQMDLTERTVQNLENKLKETKKVYGENSVEVLQLETKLNDARTTIAKFSKSLDGIKESSDHANDGLEGLGKKMDLNNLMEATEMLSGMTDSILNLGNAARDYALKFGDSQTYLQANLGLTAEESEKLNGVVDEVFKNGVVGSIDEAAEAVMFVKQSFKDLNDSDLEKLTNNITTIAKRTGTDVQANVIAANRLMDEFGISAEEATDLIAAGFQNGLNKSDDFLDTLNEYTPHFELAGYSANEMMQIIQNGMENGAMNTDKAADAVKEFQIRLGDGSIKNVIGEFSTDTQGMFKQWEDGKVQVSDVAESISKDLNKMSPKEQQEALSLLSSQFEDLGIDGAAALFNVGDAFNDVNGKADEMSKKSPGEEWESSLRELQNALLPIGQQLIDTFTPVVEKFGELSEGFTNLSEPAQTFIIAFGGILAVVGVIAPIIMAIVGAFLLFGSTLGWVILIIVGVAAAIAGIIVAVQNWGSITDWFSEKWSQFTEWLEQGVSELAEDFVNYMEDLKEGAVDKFEDLREGATEKLDSLRDKASEAMKQAKEKILSPVEEARDKISEIVGEIKGFFSNLKLKLPKIDLPSMPKFELETSSKTIMGKKISYPTGFDVKWNARGAIFTQPTIFGQYGGQLQGGGEAGPEAALPLTEDNLGAIGRGIASTMQGVDGEVTVHVYLDMDEVTTKMAPGMSKKINANNKIGVRKVAFS